MLSTDRRTLVISLDIDLEKLLVRLLPQSSPKHALSIPLNQPLRLH